MTHGMSNQNHQAQTGNDRKKRGCAMIIVGTESEKHLRVTHTQQEGTILELPCSKNTHERATNLDSDCSFTTVGLSTHKRSGATSGYLRQISEAPVRIFGVSRVWNEAFFLRLPVNLKSLEEAKVVKVGAGNGAKRVIYKHGATGPCQLGTEVASEHTLQLPSVTMLLVLIPDSNMEFEIGACLGEMNKAQLLLPLLLLDFQFRWPESDGPDVPLIAWRMHNATGWVGGYRQH